MSNAKRVPFGPQAQEALNEVVRKICKEHKTAVEAELDSRKTYKDEGEVQWQAYARFLLADGHTVFVNLRTMVGTYSKEVNKRAQGSVARKEKRAADREARKLARAAKKATAKSKEVEPMVAVSRAAHSKKAAKPKLVKVKLDNPKGIPVVKYDPALPTLALGKMEVAAK